MISIIHHHAVTEMTIRPIFPIHSMRAERQLLLTRVLSISFTSAECYRKALYMDLKDVLHNEDDLFTSMQPQLQNPNSCDTMDSLNHVPITKNEE